jgi:hypothetical protein
MNLCVCVRESLISYINKNPVLRGGGQRSPPNWRRTCTSFRLSSRCRAPTGDDTNSSSLLPGRWRVLYQGKPGGEKTEFFSAEPCKKNLSGDKYFCQMRCGSGLQPPLRSLQYSPSMLEPVRPGAVSPNRALYLPTFSYFVIVNKTSLSLSPSPTLPPSPGRTEDQNNFARPRSSRTWVHRHVPVATKKPLGGLARCKLDKPV